MRQDFSTLEAEISTLEAGPCDDVTFSFRSSGAWNGRPMRPIKQIRAEVAVHPPRATVFATRRKVLEAPVARLTSDCSATALCAIRVDSRTTYETKGL